MNVERLLTRDCMIVHRTTGTTDDYGNEIPGEALIDTRCYCEQRRSTEPAGVGERASTDWLVVLPADTTVTVADKVRIDGTLELEVIGDPWPAHDPWAGQTSHIELLARETG